MTSFPNHQFSTGVVGLDDLLGGGIDRGNSVLIMGPAGSGKSTIALQCANAASLRGERAAVFTFDETLHTLRLRLSGLGIDIDGTGNVHLQQIDPAELSPGEFAAAVRRQVEPEDGSEPARVVIIDSLNGFLQSMMEERTMVAQLHEMLTYLGQRGVATLLVVAQQGIVGAAMQSPVDATYLADTVLLLRYYEYQGAVHRAISVVKRRSGRHENSIRELTFAANTVAIGPPLKDFRGILTGVPLVESHANGTAV